MVASERPRARTSVSSLRVRFRCRCVIASDHAAWLRDPAELSPISPRVHGARARRRSAGRALRRLQPRRCRRPARCATTCRCAPAFRLPIRAVCPRAAMLCASRPRTEVWRALSSRRMTERFTVTEPPVHRCRRASGNRTERSTRQNGSSKRPPDPCSAASRRAGPKLFVMRLAYTSLGEGVPASSPRTGVRRRCFQGAKRRTVSSSSGRSAATRQVCRCNRTSGGQR